MKVKYDPAATYVLIDFTDDTFRIVCEATNTSIMNIEGHEYDSGFIPNLKTIKALTKIGYKIVQEWK